MTYIDEIINYGLQSDAPSIHIVIINSLITLAIVVTYLVGLLAGAIVSSILFFLFLRTALLKPQSGSKYMLISIANFTVLCLLILVLSR